MSVRGGWRYLEGEEAGAQSRDALRHADVGALAQREQLAPVQLLRGALRALLPPIQYNQTTLASSIYNIILTTLN